MLIKEVPFDLWLPKDDSRTAGIHLSSIIRCVAIETGILTHSQAEDYDLIDIREITDPDALIKISIGLAWERYYLPVILERYGVIDHPGEMARDGVYMTPDGESLSVILTLLGGIYQLVQQVHEVKATYKSVRTVGDLKSQWMWMAQIKAYCAAKGTLHAVLHCLFLCGDYTYPIRPKIKSWQIEFTQDELDNNWNMLRDFKDAWLSTRVGRERWLE